MLIAARSEIVEALRSVDAVAAMEQAFVAYSAGRAIVPPVGELAFEDPPGDVHIKYGYVPGGEFYVIKVASGFYENPSLGLSSSNGVMLLFRQRTGEPAVALLDEGYLTDVRTAAAGAVCAKYLAPSRVVRIGILGTGIQARLQLEHLVPLLDCRLVTVWGRTRDHAEAYATHAKSLGCLAEIADAPSDVAAACNLIVTTTPSAEPLLAAGDIRPGTHITAVGSDTPGKQELDAAILAKADVVVADSLAQCGERGEISQALKRDAIQAEERVVELGAIIAGEAPGRTNDEQTTVADLTGVAVQDIAIAEAVYRVLTKHNPA